MPQRLRTALVTAALATLALSACSGPSSGGDAEGPVELEFWAWASGIEERVNAWNADNPDIQVNLSAPASAADMPVRVLSAVRAGDGPDLAQVEYTQLPSYVSAGVLAPLDSEREVLEEAFAPSVLETVSFDDSIYAIPQDLGPALLFYRTDLFAEVGLTPPTTWDEVRTQAEQVRALEGDRYLLNFSSVDASVFMGLALQNGAEWWDYSGGEWEVNIDDEATTEVLEFWQGMIEDDLVSTNQGGSPEQIEATSSGRTLATISGAWGPGPLLNQHPDTVGLWSATQIPQWDAANPRVFANGGSTNAVLADSEHYDASVEFISWLNASDEGAEGLVEINKFTGALHGQQVDRTPPALMPDDTEYWSTAAAAADDLLVAQWGPNTQVAFTALSDEIGDAIAGSTAWDDVLPRVQQVVSDDLAG